MENPPSTCSIVTAEQFQTFAENAKKGCPISRALASTNITMSAKLL
jgi:organic hydroperoxide reductase OsmC/OhrA